MTIATRKVSWKAGGRIIVDGVTLAAEPGMMLGLLGPNGSGKSSLLRLMAGLRTPASGEVSLDGACIRRLQRRKLAQKIALVEQHATTEANVTVQDVVRLGRTPHRSALAPWTRLDDEIVEQSLERVELSDRRNQLWHTLSGGERQRVHLARALAQQPSDLILDEPTNHLDIQHQLDILKLVSGLPIATVVALHDLNLAAMFCQRVAVMHGGRLVALGTPETVLTESLIAEVFGVRACISGAAANDRIHIQYQP